MGRITLYLHDKGAFVAYQAHCKIRGTSPSMEFHRGILYKLSKYGYKEEREKWKIRLEYVENKIKKKKECLENEKANTNPGLENTSSKPV